MLLGIDTDTFERVWQHPLKNCWKKTKKGLVNSRLEDERKWAKQRSKRATEAALTKWPESSNGNRKKRRPSLETEKKSASLRSSRLAQARQIARHTKEEWRAMLEIFGPFCLRCGEKKPLVKDHITPIYKGGSDGVENIQPLCAKCNASKGPEQKDYRDQRVSGWRERLRTACETPPKTPSKRMPPKDPDPDLELDKNDLCSADALQAEAIPDGVTWEDTEGVQIEPEWEVYLSDYLKRYGQALDEVAPSSKGVQLTRADYQAALEDLNAYLLANRYLRPGPNSNEAKWKQFKALVRNHFVRKLIRKRGYVRSRDKPTEPKGYAAIREYERKRGLDGDGKGSD
jgi:5-methylcytosine-specific restriction endonuclease McrA